MTFSVASGSCPATGAKGLGPVVDVDPVAPISAMSLVEFKPIARRYSAPTKSVLMLAPYASRSQL